MKILKDTFQPTTVNAAEVGDHYAKYINGTVDVEYRGKIVTVNAIKHDSNEISALGFMGRYRTSTKLWRVGVFSVDKSTYVNFGFESRSGRHHKGEIFYSPETFFAA